MCEKSSVCDSKDWDASSDASGDVNMLEGCRTVLLLLLTTHFRRPLIIFYKVWSGKVAIKCPWVLIPDHPQEINWNWKWFELVMNSRSWPSSVWCKCRTFRPAVVRVLQNGAKFNVGHCLITCNEDSKLLGVPACYRLNTWGKYFNIHDQAAS